MTEQEFINKYKYYFPYIDREKHIAELIDDAKNLCSNDGKPIVSGSLPPDLQYLKTLIPVAKHELEATAKTIGHEPVVLNRLVQKLEQYMAVMTV